MRKNNFLNRFICIHCIFFLCLFFLYAENAAVKLSKLYADSFGESNSLFVKKSEAVSKKSLKHCSEDELWKGEIASDKFCCEFHASKLELTSTKQTSLVK